MPSVAPLGACALTTMVWRYRGDLSMTVVVKASFAFVPDRPAEPIAEPPPIERDDRRHRDHPLASVIAPSDMVPRRHHADVLVVGTAHSSQPVTELAVRLGVFRGAQPVIDKVLTVVGDAPFTEMPITYERSHGASVDPKNPAGVEARANVVLPDRRRAMAGFGPIGMLWRDRRRRRGTLKGLFGAAETVVVPPNMDWDYFQSAPADQRCLHLAGDEWIVLQGMHREHALFRTQLPGAAAVGVAFGALDPDDPTGVPIAFVADQLLIDTEASRLTVVWRGVLPVASEDAAAHSMVVAGVETATHKLALPAARPATHAPLEAPRIVQPSAMQTLPADPALRGATLAPFAVSRPGTTKPGAPIEGAPFALPPKPPSLGPVQATLDIAAATSVKVESRRPEANATLPLTGTDALDAATRSATPFVPSLDEDDEAGEGEEPSSIPFGAPWAAARAEAVPSLLLQGGHLGTLELGRQDAKLSDTSKRLTGGDGIPERRSETVPFYAPASLAVHSRSWQAKPPNDSLSVVIKASCDIIPGGVAQLRDEADGLLGDVQVDDHPLGSLLYPSDFALFKPRADVLFIGHAWAPRGGADVMRVKVRFGHGEGGFVREVAVFGDRHWNGSKAGPPSRFRSVPMVWERAYGGPRDLKNPVGLGRKRSVLPNLEDPAALITSPRHTPSPACICGIPPTWLARSNALGTYDGAWLRERWPYFPKDFDWSSMQAAPPAQCVTYPRGDEEFTVVGMHADHPVLHGELPKLAPRCFVQETTEAGGAFFEVVLRLDTVIFDMDALRLHLVWRGLLEVQGDDAPEIAALFAFPESLAEEKRSLEGARSAFFAHLAAREVVADERVLDEVPANDNQAPEPVDAARAKADAEADARLEEIREHLRAAGWEEPGPNDPPPDLPATDLAALRQVIVDAGGEEAVVDAVIAGVSAPPPELEDDAPALPLREMVLARIAQGMGFDGIDLSGGELSEIDFSGLDLDGVSFSRAKLARCKFTGASLRGALLTSCDLTEAVLDEADLSEADLHRAILHQTSLARTRLDDAIFTEVSATGADLSGARGERLQLGASILTRAHFSGALLSDADLSACKLDHADFRNASLPRLRLYDAVGAKACFDGAEMPNARANGARLLDASLRGIKAAHSSWLKGAFDGSSFAGADLADAGFERASANGAAFEGCELSRARFPRAALAGASFCKANLLRATFESADLRGADLRGSNLWQAETWKAKLEQARLGGALIKGTKLEAAT